MGRFCRRIFLYPKPIEWTSERAWNNRWEGEARGELGSVGDLLTYGHKKRDTTVSQPC